MEARFSAPVQTGPGVYPASYSIGSGTFSEAKLPGRGVDHPPHLAPMLKKEYSYTSTTPMGLSGLFKGEILIYFKFLVFFFYFLRKV